LTLKVQISLETYNFLPARPSDPPGSGFKVSGIKENEYLVLTTFSELPSFKPVKNNEQPKKFWKTTWTFFLKKEELNKTRLIVRNNVGFKPWWISIVSNAIAKPLHFIMQKKQLINIKKRIEKRNIIDSVEPACGRQVFDF